MDFWVPERLKYRIVSVAAAIVSVLWVIGAAYCNMAPSAGRGGALALILSLLLFFLGHNIGARRFALVTDPAQQVAALTKRLNDDASSARRLNKYLAFSSFLGTLTWGFGDMFAHWLRLAVGLQ